MLSTEVQLMRVTDCDDDCLAGLAYARHVAKMLEVNTSLTKLSVAGRGSQDGFGPEGAIAIAEALQANASASSLTELNMDANGVGVEGAKALAASLAAKPSSLTSLNLAKNRIQTEGAASFAEALSANESLTQLDLRFNQSGRSTVDEAAKAVLRTAARPGVKLLL